MFQAKQSIRGLVEFILRHGDIDNRSTAATDEAMQEGSRIHRKLQSMQGTEYRAEYPLKFEYDTELAHIVLEGRADGIITLTKSVTIDEIKGTYRDVSKMKEAEPVHLAQAKCYAAIYLMQEDLKKISVRMTYVNIETEAIRYFHANFSKDEILTWFADLCTEYGKWIDLQAAWHIQRQESIKNLEFPYEYRPGQKELVTHVYNTIYHEKKLFIEAPTGTGKTLSTIFPAIKSVGQRRGDKIFYLTARTIARTVAEEALEVLKEHGLKYKNVTLTAKEKICFLKQGIDPELPQEVECNPAACPYAKGHYDRINECLYNLISSEDSLTRTVIEEYALEYKVCPFELALDVSLFADCIIGDYNYVFDPRAYLRRFFGEGREGDYLFLVDEAHNLVDRGREMYSAVLVKEELLACKRACVDAQPKIAKLIDKCNSQMLTLKREHGGGLQIQVPYVRTNIEELIIAVERLFNRISDYLADNKDGEGHDEILDLYFTLSSFLEIYDLLDDKYLIYTDFNDNGDFFVKLFCVDPSTRLQVCMDRARASVLFSATLLPIQYYKSLLGGIKEDYEVYAQSVFDPKNRLLLQAKDVSSKYSDRGPAQYKRMAKYIHDIASGKNGNYMVFAPSYNYMYDVYETYVDLYFEEERVEVICQSNQMRESDKEAFLERFRGETGGSDTGEKKKTLIGFCVLGGVFSEGIDLKDDALIGVVVIGTGLPQIGGERDLLKEYFGDKGFDYAYRYPGMNRVQQAAGRLIRTESDRGVIALLDNRYSQGANRRLFPREWEDVVLVDVDDAYEKILDFWTS